MLTQSEQQALDLYEEHGSQRKAAKALGISRRAFRSRLDNANRKLLTTPTNFKTTKISTDGKGRVTAMTHKLAPQIDHLKREGKVARRSTLYGADGSVTAEWVIRKPEDEVRDEYIDALEESFSKLVLPVSAPPVLSSNFHQDDLATYFSVDEHLGVHLCAEEVGQDYGLDDAVQLMEEKFAKVVSRTPSTQKGLYVNLGDQFHANDHMDVTPQSKHPLNSSATFNTVADAVVALNRRRIDILLQKHDEVEIRGVAGNHDVDPMGWLFRCYSLAYENEDRVTVKFDSDGLGVYQFGNVMLGYHHGHKMKPDVMAGACADRYSKIYGDTTMRYLHTGHFHNDAEADIWGGFHWQRHRTMNPKDAFSYGNGYLSRQSMKSIIYNEVEGEVGRYSTTLI